MILPSGHEAHTDLVRAFDLVYEQFETEPPKVIVGCPCCIESRGTDTLLSKPLKQLSGDDLWRYTTGAFLTVGGQQDFRYLLPRIFEIAAFDPGGSPGSEIVIGKLMRADWRSWPKEDQAAIDRLVEAWFHYAAEVDLTLIEEGWGSDNLESIICGAAIAGISPVRWLNRLKSHEMLPLLLHFRTNIFEYKSPFWEDAPEAYKQFIEILN